MEQRIIVLHVNRFDFEDERTKRQVTGVSFKYIGTDIEQRDDRIGLEPSKFSLPPEQWNNVGQVPGFYDVVYRVAPGRGGKPELRPQSIHYVGPVAFVGDGEIVQIEQPSPVTTTTR